MIRNSDGTKEVFFFSFLSLTQAAVEIFNFRFPPVETKMLAIKEMPGVR